MVKKVRIKTKKLRYSDVLKIKKSEHKKPVVPSPIFRFFMRALGSFDLRSARFSCNIDLGEAEYQPCLILMNHSSFIDLEIAAQVFKNKPYCIVCTSDGFVGKEWLMRHLGCIPTNKFVRDFTLIKDMKYTLQDLHTSVLMYPEASYSFDGRATQLPRGLGRLLRILSVPVVMVKTEGAFTRDPLYNCLQKRKVKVSADARCIITKEMIATLEDSELEKILDDAFTFDNFEWQIQNDVRVKEQFRADGLERIIYRCPACHSEGSTLGKGTSFSCLSCRKKWFVDEYCRIVDEDGVTNTVTSIYDDERSAVRSEILSGRYLIDVNVKIGVMVDRKAIYFVGDGRLTHDINGFHLSGCGGELEYRQSPLASYSLYSDYYWYELGDMICIGNNDILYYCFPDKNGVVTKARLAAEELYKICKKNQSGASPSNADPE